jgi:hypothetical protein
MIAGLTTAAKVAGTVGTIVSAASTIKTALSSDKKGGIYPSGAMATSTRNREFYSGLGRYMSDLASDYPTYVRENRGNLERSYADQYSTIVDYQPEPATSTKETTDGTKANQNQAR